MHATRGGAPPAVPVVRRDTGRVEPIVALASRQVYVNNWMTVREDDIRFPDGSLGIYGVVDKPTYALVVAVDGGRLMMVEQFRYPLGMRRWEFPQGTAPDRADMPPQELAARELREETGLRARTFTQIGLLDVAPGMCSQRGHVYVATGITEGEQELEHEEQDLHRSWFTRDEVTAMIRSGEITDAQTVAAWALLLLHER